VADRDQHRPGYKLWQFREMLLKEEGECWDRGEWRSDTAGEKLMDGAWVINMRSSIL